MMSIIIFKSDCVNILSPDACERIYRTDLDILDKKLENKCRIKDLRICH